MHQTEPEESKSKPSWRFNSTIFSFVRVVQRQASISQHQFFRPARWLRFSGRIPFLGSSFVPKNQMFHSCRRSAASIFNLARVLSRRRKILAIRSYALLSPQSSAIVHCTIRPSSPFIYFINLPPVLETPLIRYSLFVSLILTHVACPAPNWLDDDTKWHYNLLRRLCPWLV